MADPQAESTPWNIERLAVGATLLLYASTLLFKVGKAGFFAIPFDLLSLKLTELVRQGIVPGFLVFVMAVSIEAPTTPKRQGRWAGLGGLRYSPAFFVLAFLVVEVRRFEWVSATCVALAISPALIGIVLTKKPKHIFLDTALSLPPGSAAPLVFSLLSCVLAAHAFGYTLAEAQTQFMVLADQPNTVILSIEGETAITAPFDRATKRLLAERRLLPVGDGSLRFQWEAVGPLSPR